MEINQSNANSVFSLEHVGKLKNLYQACKDEDVVFVKNILSSIDSGLFNIIKSNLGCLQLSNNVNTSKLHKNPKLLIQVIQKLTRDLLDRLDEAAKEFVKTKYFEKNTTVIRNDRSFVPNDLDLLFLSTVTASAYSEAIRDLDEWRKQNIQNKKSPILVRIAIKKIANFLLSNVETGFKINHLKLNELPVSVSNFTAAKCQVIDIVKLWKSNRLDELKIKYGEEDMDWSNILRLSRSQELRLNGSQETLTPGFERLGQIQQFVQSEPGKELLKKSNKKYAISEVSEEFMNLMNDPYKISIVIEDLKIDDFPNVWSNQMFNKLKYLDLKGNKLTELPDEIGLLQNLTSINMSANKFRSIPICITKIPALKYILLEWNRNLEKIPEQFFELTNLKNLRLGDTGISEIPDNISKLQNLSGLDLSLTMITIIPESVGKLSCLTQLGLGGDEESGAQIKTVSYEYISESLFSLSKKCVIDFTNSSLPSEFLEILKNRHQDPNYDGPTFLYDDGSDFDEEKLEG